MSSTSERIVSAIRFARRIWPFKAGKDFPNHLGAHLARRRWLRPVWYEFLPGLWMCLEIRDLIQETILLEGVWDPLLTEFVNNNLNTEEVFIDVGANAGYFTLLAARRVQGAGIVLSIEPNPIVAKQLRANVERSNLANVIIEEKVCSDSLQTTIQTLYLHDDSNSGRASLSKSNTAGIENVQVASSTVDQLVQEHGLRHVTLVKIDVEGAELMVLRGMTDTMRHFRPTIVIELEPHLLRGFSATAEDVVSLLSTFGYKVSSLGGHSNYLCRPIGDSEIP